MSGRFQRPHPVVDAARLAALESYGILGTAPEAGFDKVVLLARTLCAAPVALVSFVTDDHQWFKARSGFGPERTSLDQSVCAHALERTGVLVIPDLRTDPLTRDNPLVTDKPHVRFYAGAPLRTPEGYALGTLCVLDTLPRPAGLSPEQTECLEALAAQVMVQLGMRRDLIAREAEIKALIAGTNIEPPILTP